MISINREEDSPIRIPRPLWRLKEELAILKQHRPPNSQILPLTEWALKMEALEEWVQLGEKGVPVRKS